ncbi:restriction endonuclease subunit S [Agrobacterium vitis]|uniref:restriction endonuclease subunit S n=1 Tax=Agrobacterium vitis TaxID=373 RepID=UPI0012E8FD13|nr:restriction endonuclease subunit S [Agrobacterium vitis]MVA72228.1 restriction endonuclease subunit S [Agrobacterium vitis]
MSWTTAKLDELGSVGRGKSRHRPRNDPSLYGGEIPFIQTADIAAANYYIEGYSQTYNEQGLAQSKLWTEETLCITIAGENTAKTAVLNFPACFPDSIVGFVSDKEKSDLRFVKHSLDLMKAQFRSVSKGATQDNLSLAKILSFDIPIPPLPTQQRIASILSAYDDLIENNRRRIALLEQAARLLYREWFVHLRFPGHETAKIVDGLPEGWTKTTVGAHCPLIYGKALKAETRIEGSVDVYGSSGIVGTHNKALVTDPAIIVGRKGNVGSIYWARRGCWPIDTVYFVDPSNSDFFTYFTLQHITFQSTDVAVPGLNRDYAHSREIKMPTKTLVQSFNNRASVFLRQAELLSLQNNALTRARDLLLPRLMDGRIPV